MCHATEAVQQVKCATAIQTDESTAQGSACVTGRFKETGTAAALRKSPSLSSDASDNMDQPTDTGLIEPRKVYGQDGTWHLIRYPDQISSVHSTCSSGTSQEPSRGITECCSGDKPLGAKEAALLVAETKIPCIGSYAQRQQADFSEESVIPHQGLRVKLGGKKGCQTSGAGRFCGAIRETDCEHRQVPHRACQHVPNATPSEGHQIPDCHLQLTSRIDCGTQTGNAQKLDKRVFHPADMSASGSAYALQGQQMLRPKDAAETRLAGNVNSRRHLVHCSMQTSADLNQTWGSPGAHLDLAVDLAPEGNPGRRGGRPHGLVAAARSVGQEGRRLHACTNSSMQTSPLLAKPVQDGLLSHEARADKAVDTSGAFKPPDVASGPSRRQVSQPVQSRSGSSGFVAGASSSKREQAIAAPQQGPLAQRKSSVYRTGGMQIERIEIH